MENHNPLSLFEEWYGQACEKEPSDPNAMSIASIDGLGYPNVRIVLLKAFDARGFVFYTNFESQKGQELLNNAKAAAVLHWKSIAKQVRIQGMVETVSKEQADEYFQSRARLSQIGAWASKQSRPLESDAALEKNIAYYATHFGLGIVPRPDYWSGFRIIPRRIEFWQDGKFRLHQRLVFYRSNTEAAWQTEKLYP